MVGSNFYGTFGDANNEGWGGFNAGQINTKGGIGILANPNVILLHSGVNSLFEGDSPTVTATTVINGLNAMHTNHTGTIFLVAGIIGNLNTTINTLIGQLNSQVSAFVTSKASDPTWHIQFVNMYTLLNQATDYSDDTHPNASGYAKMANAWIVALNNIAGSSATSSWFTTPPTGDQPGGIGAEICPPTKPINTQPAGSTNVPIQFLNPTYVFPAFGPGQTSQNQFGGVTCQALGTTQCSCTDPSAPSGAQTATVPLPSNRYCSDMNSATTVAVQLADMNGDGLADFCYVDANGAVSTWLTNSTGGNDNDYIFGGDDPTAYSMNNNAQITVGSRLSIFNGVPAGFTAASTRSQIRLADLDGDGRADIVYVNPSGAVGFYQADPIAATTLTTIPTYTSRGNVFTGTSNGVSYPGAGLQFADLDSNSFADMVYIGTDGSITGFPNTGQFGTHNPYVNFNPGVQLLAGGLTLGGVLLNRDSIVLRDIDGDGKADLIVVNRFTGAFAAYRNIGAGPNNTPFARFDTSAPRFSQASLANVGGVGLQFGDFGGNGRVSAALVGNTTSGLATWTNNCIINAAQYEN
jgi:hypothetical protein